MSFSHFNGKTVQQLKNYENIYTAYRDPYRVAASWANRGRFARPVGFQEWITQWACYEKALKLSPVILDVSKGREQAGIVFPEKPIGEFEDSTGLHKALNEQDFELYHSVIPKWVIEYAQEKSHQP